MKKINLFIFLLLFAFKIVSAQNPNNHWQIGTADINFSTDPPTVATIPNNGQYGNASISDANGNLLFYTDGIKVWNKNHQEMSMGSSVGNSIGAESSYSGIQLQPTVIVPHPGNSKQFFVFSTRNEILIGASYYPGYSYKFFIVDFSDVLHPFGKILIPNVDNALKDESGNHFSEDFSFRPLTCVKNSTNDGYFLIIQRPSSTNLELFTYSITAAGFNPIPLKSSTNTTINYLYNPVGPFLSYTRAISKFSPNNLKFAELVIRNTSFSGPNISSSSSSLFILDFNNVTGTFSNFTTVHETNTTAGACSDFEFSSDSQKIYFAHNKIYVKDLTNIAAPIRDLSETTNSSSIPNNFGNIQRDKSGNILISSQSPTLNRNSYLHKIENQNSFSTSTVKVNHISLNGYTIPFGVFYLPQLVPQLTVPCPVNLNISTTLTSGTSIRQASTSLVASNAINSGANAIYRAGTSVVLTNGFNAKSGSVFRAYIAGCSNNATNKTKNIAKESTVELDVKKQSVKLYPNPNKGIFTINLGFENKKEMTVNIYDSVGKSVYKSLGTTSTFEISLPNLISGLYFVKVTGENFEETVKFIKD